MKPVLNLLETSLLAVKEEDDDTEFIRSLKSKILGYLQEKYSDHKTQDLLDMATTLDPRFKMSCIREEVKPTVRARLMDEMTGLTPAEVRSCCILVPSLLSMHYALYRPRVSKSYISKGTKGKD